VRGAPSKRRSARREVQDMLSVGHLHAMAIGNSPKRKVVEEVRGTVIESKDRIPVSEVGLELSRMTLSPDHSQNYVFAIKFRRLSDKGTSLFDPKNISPKFNFTYQSSPPNLSGNLWTLWKESIGRSTTSLSPTDQFDHIDSICD
jgi:hypothetical protein